MKGHARAWVRFFTDVRFSNAGTPGGQPTYAEIELDGELGWKTPPFLVAARVTPEEWRAGVALVL